MSGRRGSNPNSKSGTKTEKKGGPICVKKRGKDENSPDRSRNESSLSPGPREMTTKFYICLTCDAGVEEEEDSIQCHSCKQWCHLKCSGLSPRDFSYLSDPSGAPGIEWICETCRTGKGDKKSVMEAKIDRLIDLFVKVNDRLEKLEKGCSGKALTEKIEEVVEKRVEELWEEKVEKEKRQRNLIITNIPESAEEEKTKRNAEELEKIKDVVEKICPEFKDSIEETTRLGQFTLGSRPRLVRVRTKTLEARREILRNARKLNQGKTDQKEKIYINPDFTPAERQKNKELREELRSRISKGERDIGIRNGKIVKVQWKPRPGQGDQDK